MAKVRHATEHHRGLGRQLPQTAPLDPPLKYNHVIKMMHIFSYELFYNHVSFLQ